MACSYLTTVSLDLSNITGVAVVMTLRICAGCPDRFDMVARLAQFLNARAGCMTFNSSRA